MFISNIGSNLAPLPDIGLQNLIDFDFDNDLYFDLLRSLQVKSNGALGLPIYDILLVSNINHMSVSHHVGVIATGKKFSYLLSLGQNFAPFTKNEVGRFNIFLDNLNTDKRTDGHTK